MHMRCTCDMRMTAWRQVWHQHQDRKA
jgi:hypothetical protein